LRLLLAAVVVAASAATAATAAGGDPVVRDCATRIESGRAPIPFRGPDAIEAGPISFWLLRRAAAGLGQRYPNGRFFVKTHISVRAGRSVTVSVPERFRARLGLVRTTGDEPAPVVRFVPCAPATPAWSYAGSIGRVTGFNSGFFVTQRGCYPLDVAVAGGRTQRLRVAFGYPCR
jgi:hypothetical protein